MSQSAKADKTLNNLKKASSALATVLKLLARFFAQLGSRFDGWTIVSQRSQCDPEQLAQEEDEARVAQDARIRRDEEERIRRDEEERIRRDEMKKNGSAAGTKKNGSGGMKKNGSGTYS